MKNNRWVDNLDAIIGEMKTSLQVQEYSLNRLNQLVQPPSSFDLIEELSERISRHEILPVYKIVSPETGGAITEFLRAEDIPLKVFDDTTDRILDVDSRSLELVYRADKRFG